MTASHLLQTDPPGVIIRPAAPGDLAALGRLGALLVRLHHELDPARFIPVGPETERAYASYLGTQLDKPGVLVLVAERNGEVIGYSYAGIEGHDYMALRGPAGVLYDIVVDPTHRGNGVGRRLLDASLAALKARGCPTGSAVNSRGQLGREAPVCSRGVQTDHARDDARGERRVVLSGENQFHLEFGLPPHAYHLRLRLAVAAELLSNGLSVSTVAYECGFADQSHLSRKFKEVYGLTPAAWGTAAAGTESCAWRPTTTAGPTSVKKNARLWTNSLLATG